jgi:sugar phosphate isomerase/epimerase
MKQLGMKGINTLGQALDSGGVASFPAPRDGVSHLAFPALARERNHHADSFPLAPLGIRAHDLGTFDTIKDLASEISRYGDAIPIQLALGKVLKNAPDAENYTEQFIISVRDALKEKGAYVGVFGSYINPVHPDETARDAELRTFENHLKYANLLGCPLVGTETGSFHSDNAYHRDTASAKVLDIFYRSVERLLEAAVTYDAIVGIEAVSKQHTISTISRMATLLEKFDSPHLRVIYDPVNLVPWTGISEADGSVMGIPSSAAQKDFFCSALDAFGDKIAAIHVKDYKLNEQGFKVGDLTVGEGVLDWKFLFGELRKRNIEVPTLLEDLTVSTLKETLALLSTY